MPPSSPDNPGYLDLHSPHSINNLLLQLLGTEEVVATVRDDGDVEVILVRHIVQAIERRAGPRSTLPTAADEVRPIFQANVGSSAWGLAIHTQSRILACSSNRHEVHIFKFALLDQQGGSLNDESPSNREESYPGLDRNTDVTLRVINGDANIPYISFCNTRDDPEARWLLTTDILGICRVVDLHENKAVQQFRFGRSARPFRANGAYDSLNAGWAVMFLDPRSFSRKDHWRDALGLIDDQHLPGASIRPMALWDLSDTADHLPDNSEAFTHHKLKERLDQAANVGNAVEGVLMTRRSPRNVRSGSREQDTHSSTEDDSLSSQTSTSTSITSPDRGSRSEGASDDDEVDLVDEYDDPDDEGTEDSMSVNIFYNGRRLYGNLVNFQHPQSLCNDLPCPILHASVKNVYLVQPSDQKHHPGPFSPPMVGAANPLRQAVQAQYDHLNRFDRLNMNASIPELGIVILASQKGRALVLSLTKLPASRSKYPPNMQDHAYKTNYAMRLECILPFRRQERTNLRPPHPLHGIAVGPIQGTEDCPSDRKRWRLMMMYQDHSILSYEILGRRGGGLEEVVV